MFDSSQIASCFVIFLLVNPAMAADDPYAEPAKPGLPPSTMELNLPRTALVVTDPQIDFLSEDGVTWGLVGESVTEQNTVENIERLFKTAKKGWRDRHGFSALLLPH